MTDLPRFTQGNFGDLRFHHLNQVFDVIERPPVPMQRKTEPQESSFVYAVLTGEENTLQQQRRYSWREIERNSTTGGFAELEGGRTSGTLAEPFLIPAIAISGTETYQVGNLVLLRLESFPEGQRFALIIKPSGSDVKMFRITGAQSISAGRWKYTGVLVGIELDTWVPRGTEPYTLYNGCENPVDFGNTIGVGTVKPNNASAVRQQVRNDTIVQAVYVDFGWSFSIPNGYSFACA
jgi:hypothetical protein